MPGPESWPSLTWTLRGRQSVVVARVSPDVSGNTSNMITLQCHPRKVSLVRPGHAQPKASDVYELAYCYGQEANNGHVFERSIKPQLDAALDGRNVNIIVLGSSTSGAQELLEGWPGHNEPDSEGIAHLSLDYLFTSLHERPLKAAGVTTHTRMRGATAKSHSAHVVISMVMSCEEEITDLLTETSGEDEGDIVIVEDVVRGWSVKGVARRTVDSAEDARMWYNLGRQHVQSQKLRSSVGSAHFLTVLTVEMQQVWPSQPGEEGRILTSVLQFACSPGTERLSMDPALLALREGAKLNHSILTFSRALQVLRPPAQGTVDFGQSVMTKLLADSFGGNCCNLFVGVLRQGQLLESETLLQLLQLASTLETYPVENTQLVRGLLAQGRKRALQEHATHQALQEQLENVPCDNGVVSATSNAKVSQLLEQNVALKEESASIMQERLALQERLKRYRQTVEDAQEELSSVQCALIASESQRLEVGRCLLDAQMELNKAQVDFENDKYSLNQKILELEGRLAQGLLSSAEAAAFEAGKDEAEKDLEDTHRHLSSTHRHLEELMHRITDLEAAKHAAEQQSQEETAQLRIRLVEELHTQHERLLAEKQTAMRILEEQVASLTTELGETRRAHAAELSELRSGLQRQQPLVEKGRAAEGMLQEQARAAEKQASQMAQLKNDLNQASKRKIYSDAQLVQIQEHFLKLAKDMAGKAAQMTASLPGPESSASHLARKPTRSDLEDHFQGILKTMLQVKAQREQQLLDDIELMQQRQLTLLSGFRALSHGYRELRYKVEDANSCGARALPVQVVHEDQLLGAASNAILVRDMEEQEKLFASLRCPKGAAIKVEGTSSMAPQAQRQSWPRPPSSDPTALAFNEAGSLSEILTLTNATCTAKLYSKAERETLRDEGRRLEQNGHSGHRGHIMKLEERAQRAEIRAASAEEQAAVLSAYIARTTQAYQTEIVRLRKKLSPSHDF